MAARALPQFLVMKPGSGDATVWYKEEGSTGGLVWIDDGENNVFAPLAKIEMERAKINSNYVHLRFCYSNRYWKRSTEEEDPYRLLAESKEVVEDTSDPWCTLFEPFLKSGSSDVFYFRHVQTGKLVHHYGHLWVDPDGDAAPNDYNYFTVVDWETLVQLPDHVAFKGENGMYLNTSGNRMFEFAETDPNSIKSGHTIERLPDGHVRIRSDQFGRYWRMDGDWIFGDSSDTTANDSTTLFWPVKVDASTIALRCKNTGKFCNRYRYDDGNKDHLASASPSMTAETKLQVEELTLDRKIYYVDYRMEDARIFDEQPYLAGTALLINATDNQTSESVTITYQDEKSYTFSRGVSITAGVSTTIEAGVPFIAEGKIEVSLEVSGNFQWDTTTTTTTSVAATGTVDVPPRSSVIIEYVGTRGSCNIPYSYSQLDKSATDGKIKRDEKTDGTYTGVSCYNFSFKMSAPQSII